MRETTRHRDNETQTPPQPQQRAVIESSARTAAPARAFFESLAKDPPRRRTAQYDTVVGTTPDAVLAHSDPFGEEEDGGGSTSSSSVPDEGGEDSSAGTAAAGVPVDAGTADAVVGSAQIWS